MSLSAKQERLYWRLWAQVKRAAPATDRHELHAAPSTDWPRGLPASHTGWGNAEFDEYKARCLAIVQPADLRGQLAQAAMPAERERVYIRHLLACLEKPASYAEEMVSRMLKNDRARWSRAGSAVTLETLDSVRARHVVIELKEQCRRVWKRKSDLLEAIYMLREAEDFDEAAALEQVKQALNRTDLGRGLSFMSYDALLVVLSALRTLAEEPF